MFSGTVSWWEPNEEREQRRRQAQMEWEPYRAEIEDGLNLDEYQQRIREDRVVIVYGGEETIEFAVRRSDNERGGELLLTRAQIEALAAGHALLAGVNGEYIVTIRMERD